MHPYQIIEHQVAALRRRLEMLDRRVAGDFQISDPLIWETREDLSAALEELQISEEELRLTNEELVAAQQDLEAERKRYRELFHGAPDAYLITDPGGTIREANRTAADLFGAPPLRLTGKPLAVYIAEPDRRRFRRQLARLFEEESEERAESELLLAPPTGESVPAAATARVVRDSGGAVNEVRWLLRDISERKRTEERKRQLAAERAAREEAEAASQAKSHFLAVMSHELRTPLTAIMGYAELLALGVPQPIPGCSREHVERIDDAARHLLRIIEEILTFSRIEAGHEDVRWERIDLGEVAAEAVSYIRPLATHRGLSLSIDALDAPVYARADRGKTRQILINLLSNAVKFTREGEIRIEVESSGEARCVRVQDTGIGIAAEHIERIFEPFWQAQGGLTREAGGTGLGLTVSRRMAERMGGTLIADSAVGRGTTFTLCLPVEGAPPGGAEKP